MPKIVPMPQGPARTCTTCGETFTTPLWCDALERIAIERGETRCLWCRADKVTRDWVLKEVLHEDQN